MTMCDLNPQEFDGTNMDPNNIDPPDPPEPEDEPEEYAIYLRRRVVAMVRRYFVEHGHKELEAKDSYAGLPGPGIERRHVALEDIVATIKDLDDWKREFNLKDID